MNLNDALDDNSQSQGGCVWPGPAKNPVWPGPQPSQPSWPGGNSGGGMWGNPAQPPCPSGPAWPQPAAQQNMSVPYKQNVTGIQGKVIAIAGTVKSNPNMLTVDLMAGQELVFHFNPRFKDEADGKVTVMNSCLCQNWGSEERDRQGFPFTPGQPFQLKIHCTSQGFRVEVNGRDRHTYKHRADPRSIDSIHIYNDLSLSSVNFI